MIALLADLWYLFARRRNVTTGVIPGGPAPGVVHTGQGRRGRKGGAGAS